MDKFKNLDGIVDIIVLAKINNQYKWYCSDKVFWIMDYAMYAREFNPNDNDFSERFDIGILDEFSATYFFERMKEYETSCQELQTLFKETLPVDSFDDAYHLFPKLFVDFDSREMYSLYSELLRLENYAPSSWESYYKDFYSLIPLEYRYWVIDNFDYYDYLIN